MAEGTLEVPGSNTVTIVGGRNTMSDYFDQASGDVPTISNSSLHVLTTCRQFDLNRQQVIGINGGVPGHGQELATAPAAEAHT